MPPKNIVIRLCLPEEISQVVNINAQWQRIALGGNLKNGFVTGSLDPNYLNEVIGRNEIVVALDGNLVVGYYMINDIEHSPSNFTKIKEMVDKEYLSSEVKVGFAAQSAIILAYHGNGIALAMLREFALIVKDNYEILVTSIDKLNSKNLRRQEKNSSWIIFDEDDELVYIFYDLHQKGAMQKYFITAPIKSRQNLLSSSIKQID